ncbi:putative ribonuclease H-like domain-containing protein [Tanacetum coccineum]
MWPRCHVIADVAATSVRGGPQFLTLVAPCPMLALRKKRTKQIKRKKSNDHLSYGLYQSSSCKIHKMTDSKENVGKPTDLDLCGMIIKEDSEVCHDFNEEVKKFYKKDRTEKLQFVFKMKPFDNGTEFKNMDFIEFCGSKGIKREYSNAKTPQQNVVAERMSRTLIEAARTMLAGKRLTWLFDLDYLTDSMNYQHVRSKNQANKHAGPQEANQNAGTKDNIDVGDSENEKAESAQDNFYCQNQVIRRIKSFDALERLKRQEQDANDTVEALSKTAAIPRFRKFWNLVDFLMGSKEIGTK